jgi:transposase
MKNKNINPTLHDKHNPIATAPAGNAAVSHTFKLGLDVDLNLSVTAISASAGVIALPQKFSRAQLLAWVQKQVAAGHEVHTVYEACGFGYTLHHQLTAAGVRSLITTPMRLNLERRRKNDRMDARELCVRLSRHLDGHGHELKPIRIPTAQEQQRRELGRQRDFFKRELVRLENHGRALRIEFEHETLPAGWAGPRLWKKLSARCSEFVRAHLDPVGAQIGLVKEPLAGLTEQIESRVAQEKIPHGLGALTVAPARWGSVRLAAVPTPQGHRQ